MYWNRRNITFRIKLLKTSLLPLGTLCKRDTIASKGIAIPIIKKTDTSLANGVCCFFDSKVRCKVTISEDDTQMKILLVEDDRTIASGLEYSLQQDHFSAVLGYDTVTAKHVIAEQLDQFTLCLFDLSLPDGDGYELCKMVKERSDIPVIFLTAIDDEVNVVMGLDMGGDDYITKPFRIRELLSRIKSVLRRYHKQTQTKSIIEIENIRINTLEGKVYKNGDEISLTALEYRLLLIFANHIGQILSRNQLLERIWDVAGDFVNDNTLTVYIKRLREKLEDNPQDPKIIKTVRGLGYKVGD